MQDAITRDMGPHKDDLRDARVALQKEIDLAQATTTCVLFGSEKSHEIVCL